jgi:hypothetical protein
VTGVSVDEGRWREVVEHLVNALRELHAVWPRVAAAWADLEAVCGKFWAGLSPLDEAVVRVVRWEGVEGA